MSNLGPELDKLKQELLDMADLVKDQLYKSKEAIINKDTALAQQIIDRDKKVNKLELRIDKNCKNILALFNPVAIDLRFVLATLKINNDLERIGDNAEGIAWSVFHLKAAYDGESLKKLKVLKMFDYAIAMVEDFIEALHTENTKLAKKILKKDTFLNKNNADATTKSIQIIQKEPEKAATIIPLLNVIKKLERVGDLAVNLGEEVIFYVDAKVMKHKKAKKPSNKKKASDEKKSSDK